MISAISVYSVRLNAKVQIASLQTFWYICFGEIGNRTGFMVNLSVTV